MFIKNALYKPVLYCPALEAAAVISIPGQLLTEGVSTCATVRANNVGLGVVQFNKL